MLGDFDNSVRDTLCQVIGSESSGLPSESDWVDDPVRCRNRLYDSHPHAALEIHLLYLAHRMGVPDSLRTGREPDSKRPEVPLFEAQKLADTLRQNNGLTRRAARWAVGMWADALGIDIQDRGKKFDSPAIISFDAEPHPESDDETQVLVRWNVWGKHETITLTPPGVEVDPKGKKALQADQQTTYQLRVYHEGETLKRSTTAGPQAPEVKEFYSEYRSYAPGEKAAVRWKVANADEVRLYPGSKRVTNKDHAEVQVSSADPTRVTIHASSPAGIKTREQIRLPTVQVRTFRHVSTDSNSHYKLEWEVENAVRVKVDGEDVEVSHSSKQFPNASGGRTHVLTAYAASGAVCHQRLELKPSRIRHFQADRIVGIEGETVNLTWEVENAERVLIDDGIQLRDVTGENETKVQIRKGENCPRLLADGPINRRQRALQIWGISGSDVIQSVKVPDATLNVSVNEIATDLNEIGSMRIPVGEGIVPKVILKNRYGSQGKEEKSLMDMVRKVRRGKPENEEIIPILKSVQSGGRSTVRLVGNRALRGLFAWIDREMSLMAIVPRATWGQIQSILRRARSLLSSDSE